MSATITVIDVTEGEPDRRFSLDISYGGKTASITISPSAAMAESEDDSDVLRRELLTLVEALLGWGASHDEIAWKQSKSSK